jgi:hypothetical protein
MAAHAIYQNDIIRDLVVEAVSSLDSGKQTIDKLLTTDRAFFASAVKSRWSEIREDRLSKCKNTGCPEVSHGLPSNSCSRAGHNMVYSSGRNVSPCTRRRFGL